jgi:transposase
MERAREVALAARRWPLHISQSPVILLLAEGHTWDEASERIECSRGFVASWSKRVIEQRIAGLYSRHIGQVATVLTPELEARILDITRRAPSSSTHWTTRKLATRLGISHMMVARVWRKHRLKPHRIERYMASNDPDFEKKAGNGQNRVGPPNAGLEHFGCAARQNRSGCARQ